MSEGPANSVLSSAQLDRFVQCSGENDNIDAKAPMEWDGGPQSASLAKDIAAFANSADGGVLVIGKVGKQDGTFELRGVTDQQSASFDTTKVANWINSRFAPPIHLTCYPHKHDQKTFVVITIREFDDVPAICTRSLQHPEGAKKHLLREGLIYVRGANAESKPAQSVEEWRTIIGLAVKKRGNEFLSFLNAMLKGRSLAPAPTDAERFDVEIERVRSDLNLSTPEAQSRGAWSMWFRPVSYTPDRWPDDEKLEQLVRQHSVRLYSRFPASQSGTSSMGWGIANNKYGGTWALTRSGVFFFHREFYENQTKCAEPGYRGGGACAPLARGTWISFQWAMQTLMEFFHFMSRFATEYEAEESLFYQLVSGPLSDRRLASTSPGTFVAHGVPEPCRAREWSYTKETRTTTMRANWEGECAEAMKTFFELFSNPRISIETLRKWVECYKNREF